MAQDHERPSGKDTIDVNLKRVYEEMLDEDVPERFRALLDQLKEQDNAKQKGDGEQS